MKLIILTKQMLFTIHIEITLVTNKISFHLILHVFCQLICCQVRTSNFFIPTHILLLQLLM